MTRIEVFCGFLESGKTTLIQHILEQEYIENYKKILILQCEDGEVEFRAPAIRNKNVLLDQIDRKEKICYELFYKIKLELNPDLVLIEYNGTWPIETLLTISMPKNCKIDRIFFCADASTFDFYMKNTGGLMANQLANADAVFFNRVSEGKGTLRNTVRSLNRSASIFFSVEPADSFFKKLFDPETFREDRLHHRIFLLIASASLVCMFLLLTTVIFNPAQLYASVQSVNMVFIGILMQAVPFLLIGAFVSALLQVFIPDETLVRLFAAHKWLGFPLAVILGFFFPVCDCGIVPIASRLAQKGVPLPEAMVFMLAAPAVNPVTILSTLYAFPGQPQYVLCRIGFGILISLIAGSILGLTHQKASLVLSGGSAAACSCGSGGCVPRHSGKAGKLEAVFMTAGQEFLGMGRYIIIGSLLCATLQQALPASLFQSAGGVMIVPIFLMLLAAFFMSVCSTSNAFIGRSFLNVFPPVAVLAFIVMGPMLDLSNLFMLSASFKKKFVSRLAGTLFVTGLLIFLLLSLLQKGRAL
ncbi:permease [Caproicibacter fermentans]|uniref:Permease n=1 Tax=Caproicibacter fermentans TaxID=2576756 RepID=A0A7G8TA51_9FIRM|nr:permease [Caproicibacter fermentans]QNK40492.1 permease [Caproicibacter fermentans]